MPRLLPPASVLTVLLVLLLAAPAHGQIFVDDDATGGADGSSWANAYTDLQTAIDNATSSDEIWVAEGIYKPAGETESFSVTGAKNGLEIYGGFEGNESNRAEREPRVHRTILSGDLNGDDMDPDGDGIIEDADPDDDGTPENLSGDENAHHVLFLDGTTGGTITTSTVIDGVTVTAGEADGGGDDDRGGGLLCYGEGSGNACSPTLKNVIFIGNAASDFGGAVFNAGNSGRSTPTITSATFKGNSASSNGGAIYNHGAVGGTSSPQITNAVFTGNSADGDGGAIFNFGGFGGTSSPHITNATFEGNAASDFGGAIYSRAIGTSEPQITNTILWGNSASTGSEIYNRDGATPTVSHSIVQGSGGSNNWNTSLGTNGGNNLDQDPQFQEVATPAGPDGIFATPDDGLAVLAGSPAQDAGDNAALPSVVTEDITGAARSQDMDGDGTATVNLGAYEVRRSAPPVATTGSVQNVTGTTADLTGTVNPHLLETTVQVKIYPAADPSDVRTVPASAGPLTGGAGQNVTVSLSKLMPDTKYMAGIVASNSKGADSGSDVPFTTTSDGYARRISGTDGTGNDAGWRMLALPAQGKTRAALEGDLTFSASSGSILYRWTSGAWSAQTNSSAGLPRGKGFMLYFFDDVLDPLDSDGLLLAVGEGSEDPSTDVQVNGLSQSETFHLVGNPFDTAFDLSELNLSAQGFQTTVQIWDPSSQTYTQVTQGDADDEIAAWQGFFVERSTEGEGGESLTFPTAGKQSGDGDLIGSQSATLAGAKRNDEKRLRLDLRLAAIDSTGRDTPSSLSQSALARPPAALDTIEGAPKTQAGAQGEPGADTIATGRLGLLLSETASAGWDGVEARQIGPPGGGKATVALTSPLAEDGTSGPEGGLVQRALASEPYPTEDAAATLPVSVRVPDESPVASARARLGLPEARREALAQRLPADWVLRLTDTRTNEHTDLLSERHAFELKAGAGTHLETASESRFRLAVGPRSALPVTDGLRLSVPYPNPTTRRATVEYAVPQEKADGARLEVYDVLGRRVRAVSVKAGPRIRQLDVSGLASGTYFLRLSAEGAQQTRKMTVVR